MTTDIHSRLAVVESQLKTNTAITQETAVKMKENTDLTQASATQIKEIREFLEPLQGGFKALEGIGRVTKLFTPFVVIAAGFYAIAHGKAPDWKFW